MSPAGHSLGSVLLGAVLVLIAGDRPGCGATTDPVLGAGPVEALGSAALPRRARPGAGGRCRRRWSAHRWGPSRARVAAVLALAALGIAGVVALVAADPVGTLGRQAAASAGRTGVVEVTAELAPGLWIAAAGSLFVLVSAVIGAVGSRRWAGLSARYDAPAPAADSRERSGPPGTTCPRVWTPRHPSRDGDVGRLTWHNGAEATARCRRRREQHVR